MKNYHLHLRGVVGGYDFDSRHVQNVLTANKNKPVDVLIDSLGGSVATALTIASAFRDHGDVHVHFVGMNASAATIASMGAKRITMDSSAMYLVHKCSSEFFQWASLNADQLEQQIADLTQMKTDLEKIDANVASMYAKRCGKERDALLQLMKIGGWLNATEAKDWGFVDEITDEAEDAAPVLTDTVASAMAAAGMPIPNVPIQSCSQFQKFLTALTDFFKSGKSAEQPTPTPAPTEVADTAQPNQPQDTMKHLFPLILAAAGVAAELYSVDAEGAVSFSKEHAHTIGEALASHKNEVKAAIEQYVAEGKEALDKLDAAQAEAATLKASLDAKNLEIQQLQAKVEELGKQPGDTTQQVHNNAGGQEPQQPKTEVEAFFETNYSARKLFDMLP